MKVTTFATALLLASASAAASAEQRIATFDLGSLDTLDALGASEHVVGVPKASLPSYLEQYAADAYTDIGGLRSPDMGALADANPTLIVQTGSTRYQSLLTRHELTCSMSAKGNCYDNACAESFFHSLKVEAIHGEQFTTRNDMRRQVFEYVELDYNKQRRHSAIGMISPEAFEARMIA